MRQTEDKPGNIALDGRKQDAKTHLFDQPRNIQRTIHVLYAVCAVSLLLDFAIHRHIDHPWEGIWGFYALYGFIACIVLVLVAKELRKLVMRGEDYYDDK